MTQKDLQIGDWVYRIDFNTPVPVKIIGIEIVNYDKMEYVVDVLNKNEHNIHLYLDEIEPIPLTTEILEKYGFVYDEDRKSYLMGVIFQVKPERYGLFSLKICGCPYPLSAVHQFQHALRLCGIDKDIEL